MHAFVGDYALFGIVLKKNGVLGLGFRLGFWEDIDNKVILNKIEKFRLRDIYEFKMEFYQKIIMGRNKVKDLENLKKIIFLKDFLIINQFF